MRDPEGQLVIVPDAMEPLCIQTKLVWTPNGLGVKVINHEPHYYEHKVVESVNIAEEHEIPPGKPSNYSTHYIYLSITMLLFCLS